MDDENRELLKEVITSKLNKSFEDTEEGKEAFEDAMNAIDRQIAINKTDEDTKSSKWSTVVEYVKIGAMIAVPVIELACKWPYVKEICNFEKDYVFTTGAGKGILNMFKIR